MESGLFYSQVRDVTAFLLIKIFGFFWQSQWPIKDCNVPHHYNAHAVYNIIKGQFSQIMQILSSFAHPQIVPDTYTCVCSIKHKERYL